MASSSKNIKNQVISMYVKGMTRIDISKHVKETYRFGISEDTVLKTTNRILPIIQEY